MRGAGRPCRRGGTHGLRPVHRAACAIFSEMQVLLQSYRLVDFGTKSASNGPRGIGVRTAIGEYGSKSEPLDSGRLSGGA